MRIGDAQLVRALGAWRRPGGALSTALVDAVREALLDGRLRSGGVLPAERRLAAVLGVSRGTVTSALAVLRDDGWLDTRPGSGSTLRLPPAPAEPIAPASASGVAGTLDLRTAVPAAPRAAYRAALGRALEHVGPVLTEDGEPGCGLPALRALIADRYTGEGLPTRPEQILVTSGARGAFALLCAQLRPRVAAVEMPTYFAALAVLRGAGTRLAGSHVTSTGWDLAQLEAAFAAAQGGLAYLVPDFHNPTGALMDPATRRAVAAAAVRHDVTVIADETMRDLDLRDDPPPLPPRIRRAVLIGSASKTVWAGLRIGWIRATATLIGELSRNPLCAPLAAPPMEQLIAVELLRDPGPVLHQRLADLRRQRDHLSALLTGDDRWSFDVPPGGLALWLRLRTARADEVVRRAQGMGVQLASGSRFAADAALLHHLRIPFTPPLAGLDRIAAALDAACPY